MCSILGSFEKEKIRELVDVNKHRGNFSYSITAWDIEENLIVEQYKDFGDFDHKKLDKIIDRDDIYYLCHVQAPTGGMMEDITRVHPVRIDTSYLFHNGILQRRTIKKLQKKYSEANDFDSYLLLKSLIEEGFEGLSDIEGLFTCAYIRQNALHLFRTKHGKLYADANLSISSEKFPDSFMINYDTIYRMNLKDKVLDIIDEFETKKYNLILEGEL